MNVLANHPIKHAAAGYQAPNRSSALLLSFTLLTAALTLSGCVGLTGAGTPAQKSGSSTGTAGTLSASATSLSFGSVLAGSSGLLTLTVTNTGRTAVTITQETVNGAGFSVVGGTTTVSIPAGQDHGFQFKFAPAGAGAASGSATLASDATNPLLGISLSGTGMAALAITTQPASASVTAGQTATFSVTATGAPPLTYQWSKGGSAIVGANSPSYTTPATSTADSGEQFTVTVSDDGSKVTSAAARLTVNGAPAAILDVSQTNLNFSSVDLGSKSVLPVVLTNGGNAQITISNITLSGPGYTASGLQTGQILTPGQSATLNVTFAPAGTGVETGSVKVTSNASNPAVAITLTGTGIQQQVSHSAALTWTSSTSGVAGYNAYRSTVSGGPYTKLNGSPVAATTYTDAAVQSSQIYYYVVTSMDVSGNESLYSMEVSAAIP